MAEHGHLEAKLIGDRAPSPARSTSARLIWIAAVIASVLSLGLLLVFALLQVGWQRPTEVRGVRQPLGGGWGEGIVESEVGVVAADDGECSEVGVAALRAGGHAVDAAVATALCLGVVHSMSSGIGGGAFIVVWSSDTAAADAFDSRETAPAAASQNMYEKNPSSKSKGALSMGIPGEIAGLYAAWLKYGRLQWKDLFLPSIKLARDGYVVGPYLAHAIEKSAGGIMADPGLRAVFAPKGKLLQVKETCYNPELANTLEVLANEGPQAFYNGSIGEKFIRDVQNAGGIATVEDLKKYRVEATEAMSANVMGYTILGMPPPSSGTLGMAMVLNILSSYGSPDAVKGLLGLHRLIEAIKHMFALRMNLGDPEFVGIKQYVDDMLSPSFAETIRQKILDNTTFGPGYYMDRWSQLEDHGTSHFCIVDAERNAVSLTSTVNYFFGAEVLSPSTGIVLNNEMDDFSTPTEATPDTRPPAPANFIEPGKRPLSSMTPIIILKGNQLAGLLGASGGSYIIPAVTQVFLNHFVRAMKPLAAVQHPRVYHKLVPNVVYYENWTTVDGDHVELMEATKEFLEERGHKVASLSGGAVCQFVVHDLKQPVGMQGKNKQRGKRTNVFHGMLTAVSDPRKDGMPAGL